MLKIIKWIAPVLVILLFTIYYLHKFLLPNMIFMGEEKGFVNYDYVNSSFKTIWTDKLNFGHVISADFLNIITSGSFWKIGQSLGLSPTAVEWSFFFVFIGLTLIFTYLVLKKISKNWLLSLLLSFIYVTTIMYYTSLNTTPKIYHFLLLPSGLFLWLKYQGSGKIRFLFLNTVLIIATLSIGVNPPQLFGAYLFIFIYIAVFSLNRKSIGKALLFLTPYLINIIFVFALNYLYLQNLNGLVKYDIFNIGFVIPPTAYITDILRFFGGWWDYGGANGIPYNDAGWYYYSPIGIIISYIPFFILIFALFSKKLSGGLKIKLLALFIITIFLVKGAEPPLGSIFAFLFHINFFKMFREPWAKFMPDFIMVTLIIIAYIYKELPKKFAYFLLFFITIFFLFQLYPIASNAIIKTRDHDWKMLDVKIPQYWYDVANWTKRYADGRRILVLPAVINNTYNRYPSYYDWKPYPFYGDPSLFFVYGNVVQNTYIEPENIYITKNVIEKINPQLISSLAIDYVIYQNDLVIKPNTTAPYFSTIISALDINNKITFGKVDIYPVKKDLLQPKIRAVNKIQYSNDPCQTYTQENISDQTVVLQANLNRNTQTDLYQVPYKIQKISSTEYHITFFGRSKGDTGLLFMDTFNKGWSIKGAKNHSIGNCFANFWILPKNIVNQGSVDLQYDPQVFFSYILYIFVLLQILIISSSLFLSKFLSPKSSDNAFLKPELINKYKKYSDVLNYLQNLKFLYNKNKNKFFNFLKTLLINPLTKILVIPALLAIIINRLFPYTIPGDPLAILFILLWLLFTSLYRMPIIINYFITYLLIIIMIILRMVDTLSFFTYAEVTSSWVLLFLIIDLLQLTIFKKREDSPLSLKTTFKEYRSDLIRTGKFIAGFTDLFFDFIIKLLSRYYRYVDNPYLKKSINITIVIFKKIKFYVSIIVTFVKNYIIDIINAYKKRNYGRVAIKVGTVLVILVSIYTVNYEIIRVLTWRTIQPDIIKIEPQLVYRTNKIILWGRSFGADPDGTKVMINSSYGVVHKDFWTDSKIYFTVPENWKDGPVHIWIEKPIQWDGKWLKRVSNVVTIQLIPTTSTITPLDDKYFKQLDNLDHETLRLNGYEK